jgi:hypothetical protein
MLLLLFGGWATSIRPLALRPRIASGLLLSEKTGKQKNNNPPSGKPKEGKRIDISAPESTGAPSFFFSSAAGLPQ